MSQDRSVTVLTARKGRDQFQNSPPKKYRQRDDRAELDDDGVHFPEAISEIDIQQRFGDPQMRGRTDRQEFG